MLPMLDRSAPGVVETVEQPLQLLRHAVLLHHRLPAVHAEPVDEPIRPRGRRRAAVEALFDGRHLPGLQLSERDAGTASQPGEAAGPLDVQLLCSLGTHVATAAAVGSCDAVSTPTPPQASATAFASVEVAPKSEAAAASVACANVWNWASGGTALLAITWYQIRPARSQAWPPMPVAAR